MFSFHGLENKVYFTGIGYDFYRWQLDSDFIPLFFSPQICYMLIFLLNFCYWENCVKSSTIVVRVSLWFDICHMVWHMVSGFFAVCILRPVLMYIQFWNCHIRQSQLWIPVYKALIAVSVCSMLSVLSEIAAGSRAVPGLPFFVLLAPQSCSKCCSETQGIFS